MKVTELRTALENHLNLETEIEELQVQRDFKTAELARLQTQCSLSDNDALDEIARLQVLCNLLPSRIEDRELKFEASEQHIIEAGNEFVSKTLGKKQREIEQLVMDKVRKSIAHHFSDEHTLKNAISSSTTVQAIRGIFCKQELKPTFGAKGFVNQLLESWDKLIEIEKKVGTEA